MIVSVASTTNLILKSMKMNSIIYDFETLSQNMITGAAVSLAALSFDADRFKKNDGYEYEELLGMTKTIKFDVQEQVQKYNRTIQKSTLDWWKKQSEEAQKQLKPSSDDVSISELYSWLTSEFDIPSAKTVWTRGNTFDPIILRTLLDATGDSDPFTQWWGIRDTRSFIDGMLYGSGIRNTFIPDGLKEKFVGHDPKHDVVMDVMRMQYLARLDFVEEL